MVAELRRVHRWGCVGVAVLLGVLAGSGGVSADDCPVMIHVVSGSQQGTTTYVPTANVRYHVTWFAGEDATSAQIGDGWFSGENDGGLRVWTCPAGAHAAEISEAAVWTETGIVTYGGPPGTVTDRMHDENFGVSPPILFTRDAGGVWHGTKCDLVLYWWAEWFSPDDTWDLFVGLTGVNNVADAPYDYPEPAAPDMDGDGIPDAEDPDRDGDGVPNGVDMDPDDPNVTDVDTDHDGVPDDVDQDPNDPDVVGPPDDPEPPPDPPPSTEPPTVPVGPDPVGEPPANNDDPTSDVPDGTATDPDMQELLDLLQHDSQEWADEPGDYVTQPSADAGASGQLQALEGAQDAIRGQAQELVNNLKEMMHLDSLPVGGQWGPPVWVFLQGDATVPDMVVDWGQQPYARFGLMIKVSIDVLLYAGTVILCWRIVILFS